MRAFACLAWVCVAAYSPEARGTRSPPPVSDLRLGLHLGAPAGLTAALDLAPRFATHLILTPPSDGSELGARLDLLYRLPELAGDIGPVGRVLFWFGPGLRWTHDDEGRAHLGSRVPFGVSLFSSGRGDEVYAEIAPGLVFYPGLRALVEAGVGLRLALF